jgi:hypothetical protein
MEMAKRNRHKKKKTKSTTSLHVTPKNTPNNYGYFMTSPDGKNWTKHPGTILGMLHGYQPEDIDETIANIIDPIRKSVKDSESKKLFEKLANCKHKLHAVRYHLITIETEIKERVEDFRKNYQAKSGIAYEIENPRLVYETEAFLFQVKSSLDLLTQALGCEIPPLRSMHSFRSKKIDGTEHSGGAIINALRLNGFEKLGNIFDQHRTRWIQEAIDMRDTITHYSRLRDFHCFIEEPYKGEKVTIHFPTMPNGTRVDTYCQGIYDNLLVLYKNALNFIKPKS